jgi:rhomboid protease GluP
MVRIPVKETWLSRKPQENSGLVAILATLAILLVSVVCWRDPRAYALLASDSVGVFRDQEYWKVFSALMVHADLRHFLSNAVLFSVFGYLLYGYFGVWVFPVGAFALGGVVNFLSLSTYLPSEVRLVGASGMVYLMAAFWLTMYLLLERRHTPGRRLLRALGVGAVVLMPGAFDRTISYRTHWIGAVTGLLAALVFFRLFRARFRAAEVSETEELALLSEESSFWVPGGADEI